MTNVYDNLNPEKFIVFVTSQGKESHRELVDELKQCSKLITVLQMDTVLAVPNGKLPQEVCWMEKCLKKSQMAASNHVLLADDVSGGPMVNAAKHFKMNIVEPGTPSEKVLMRLQQHYYI